MDSNVWPKLDRFNGDFPAAWVRQAEQYFFFYNILPEHKLSWASFYFDGEALSWYRWLFRNKQLAGWDHFVDKLFSRFRKQALAERMSPTKSSPTHIHYMSSDTWVHPENHISPSSLFGPAKYHQTPELCGPNSRTKDGYAIVEDKVFDESTQRYSSTVLSQTTRSLLVPFATLDISHKSTMMKSELDAAKVSELHYSQSLVYSPVFVASITEEDHVFDEFSQRDRQTSHSGLSIEAENFVTEDVQDGTTNDFKVPASLDFVESICANGTAPANAPTTNESPQAMIFVAETDVVVDGPSNLVDMLGVMVHKSCSQESINRGGSMTKLVGTDNDEHEPDDCFRLHPLVKLSSLKDIYHVSFSFRYCCWVDTGQRLVEQVEKWASRDTGQLASTEAALLLSLRLRAHVCSLVNMNNIIIPHESLGRNCSHFGIRSIGEPCYRYFLIIIVTRKVCYRLVLTDILCLVVYFCSLTKVWDPGQHWCVKSNIGDMNKNDIIAFAISGGLFLSSCKVKLDLNATFKLFIFVLEVDLESKNSKEHQAFKDLSPQVFLKFFSFTANSKHKTRYDMLPGALMLSLTIYSESFLQSSMVAAQTQTNGSNDEIWSRYACGYGTHFLMLLGATFLLKKIGFVTYLSFLTLPFDPGIYIISITCGSLIFIISCGGIGALFLSTKTFRMLHIIYQPDTAFLCSYTFGHSVVDNVDGLNIWSAVHILVFVPHLILTHDNKRSIGRDLNISNDMLPMLSCKESAKLLIGASIIRSNIFTCMRPRFDGRRFASGHTHNTNLEDKVLLEDGGIVMNVLWAYVELTQLAIGPQRSNRAKVVLQG